MQEQAADTVGEKVVADIQSLANDALRLLVEIEQRAKVFQVPIRLAQLHAAQAAVAWVRDDLDGHGKAAKGYLFDLSGLR